MKLRLHPGKVKILPPKEYEYKSIWDIVTPMERLGQRIVNASSISAKMDLIRKGYGVKEAAEKFNRNVAL